jgi:Domain of unknown function (DUF4214)
MSTAPSPSIPIKPARSLQELLAHHDESFVYCAYATLLGRIPDAVGLEYYVNRVRAGYSKKHLLAQIYRSSECQKFQNENVKLASALSAFKWLSYPIIGATVCRIGYWIDHSEVKNHLRALTNQIHKLGYDATHQTDRLRENMLNSIEDIVITSARNFKNENSEKSRAEKSIAEFESSHRHLLTARATEIYGQFKKFVSDKNKGAV